MTKNIVLKHLLVIIIIVIVGADCLAQSWQWAVKLPSGNTVYDLAVDNGGYAYIATGNNTTIQKYSPKGKLVWSKSGTSVSFSKGLAFDENNNLYVAGHGYNTEWDGQKTNHIRPATGLCLFVMKLDTSGKLIWSTTLPNGGSFAAFRIIADSEGATYVHNGTGTYSTSVTKLNPDGTVVWSRGLVGQNYFAGHGDIGLDGAGNCYVTSDYGTQWYPKSSLIAKFDNYGNKLWQKNINECVSTGIDVNPDGNFLIAAHWANNCTSMYDSSGKLIWTDNTFLTRDILFDNQNNFFGVGEQFDTIYYPVIVKWSDEGKAIWNVNVPCTGNSSASLIKSTRINSSCYVAGTFIKSITIGGTVLESTSTSVFLGNLNCNFSIPPVNKIVSELYPNPFSHNATLHFEYVENEVYTLKFFDTYGQLVKTIDNITNGSVNIQRDNLSAGVYYYLLSSPSHRSQSAKFIIY